MDTAVPSAAGPLTGLFTMIDHVGIAVADLDAAVAFYRDTYGMTCLHEEVNEEQGVREAMMAVGDSGSCIQLLAPLHADTTIDAVCATLRERGVRLLYDTPKRGTSNSRVNFIHPKDAGGVLVEIVEPSADGNHH